MKKKVALIFLMLTFLCTSLACVRIDATVKVNADGTADLRVLYAVSSSLASLGDGDQDFGLSEAEIAEYKAKGITYEAYADNDAGYTGYILSRKGIKVQTTDNDETGMESIVNGDFFTVDGNHIIISFVPYSDSEYEKSGSYIGIIKNYGGYMYFNLELPVKPTNHNATSVSEDGKTLTWDLTTLGANDKIYAEFDLPSSSILIWILSIVAILIVAAIVVFIILKKRKGKAAQEPKPIEEDPVALEGGNIAEETSENPEPDNTITNE